VFLPAEDGRFFLDERRAVEFHRQRRNRALLLGGFLLLVFCLLWAFGFSADEHAGEQEHGAHRSQPVRATPKHATLAAGSGGSCSSLSRLTQAG
jgi:hypothetical protein